MTHPGRLANIVSPLVGHRVPDRPAIATDFRDSRMSSLSRRRSLSRSTAVMASPSAHFMCPSKTSSVASNCSAPHNVGWVWPGVQIVAKVRPHSRLVRACPGADAPDGRPTIDAMPLELHTQPDPDHFCETCGGPSELVSQTITSWDGNETMAGEVSPWTPRWADPWCPSRRPRHSKMGDTRVCGH